MRGLGRIRQAKAGEGGLVARRELVGREVESSGRGEKWRAAGGRAASGWWGEQGESREESRERGRADVR